MIKTVYLDMDGVIADLNAYYYKRYGIIPRNDPDHKDNWPEAVRNGMYKELPFYKENREIVYYLLNSDVKVVILSCATKANYDLVSEHKDFWLKHHGLSKLDRIYTRSKVEKADHATPDSVLIDDSPACVKPFIAAGGKAILHTDAKLTIELLKEMGV